jgi:hypothetical protein
MAKLRVLFETRSSGQAYDFARAVSRSSRADVHLRETFDSEGVQYFEVLGPENLDTKHYPSLVPRHSSDDSDEDEDANELGLTSTLCPICSGSGEASEGACSVCDGHGWVVND